jgi:sugar lactone lactonase YvrE
MKRIRLTLAALTAAAMITAAFASSASAETIFTYDHTVGEGQVYPVGIAVDSTGNIWTASGGDVRKFNPQGELKLQFSVPSPKDIKIDSKGNIWVSSESEDKLLEFNSEGKAIGSIGECCYGNGQFFIPGRFTIDSKGNFWVIDNGNNRVQQFNASGKYVSKFELPEGEGAGQFFYANGITTDSAGNLWIIDWAYEGGRIEEFSTAGKYLGQVGEGFLAGPDGDPAFDSEGFLWVVDANHYRVAKFNTALPANGPVQAFGTKGSGAGQFVNPISLAFDSLGAIWVGDEKRLEKWSSIARTKLTEMPVTEPFDGGTTSKANFSANWGKLGWAAEKGSDETTGWRPVAAFSSVAGAYLNSTITDTGGGTAVVATMAVNPGAQAERYFSAWLDASGSAGTREGYELRFTEVSSNVYNVTLSKWKGGTQTVLTSKSSYGFVNGNSFALVDEGGKVSAWTKTGSEFTQILTANDATFASGNAGIEGSGNITRLTNFKAGKIGGPPNTTITGGSAGKVTPDVAFAFSSDESGSSFECALDAGAYSACTSPKSYEGLSEGSHTFKVRAVKNGETDPTPAERTVEVKTTAKAVSGIAILDEFGRSENPLATGKWTKTSWAEEIGASWLGEYHGFGANGEQLAGAYWNSKSFSDASAGLLVSATVGTGSIEAGEYTSLWLDMPSPGSARSGYEARFTGTNGTESAYKVEIAKWVSGTRTVLASKEGFSLPVNTTFVLTETGGKLTLWTGTSSFTRVLSAYDSTYSSGYAGIEVYRGYGSAYNFRAGNVQ